MKLKTFIMSVLTSLVLVTVILVVGPCNSISKLETRVDNIDQIVTQLEANSTQLTASLNEALSEQTTNFGVVQEQLTSSIQAVEANQSTALTSLADDISTVKALVQNETAQRATDTNTLTNKINALNTSLASLSAEVSALETTVADLVAEVTEGELTAEITSTNDLEIDDGDDSFSGTIVVRLTNDTNDDIEDIELSLSFEADEDIPEVYSAKLTGGGVTWTYEGQDDNTLWFSNYSGFDVDEDSYKKMTLTLTVYFDDEVTEDTAFEASVEISDYTS
jgi:hypothetical protein